MKTNRELLELAAKAAGYGIEPHPNAMLGGLYFIFKGKNWNPLTDDGDEARLEAQCGLSPLWLKDCVYVGLILERYASHNGDKQAARRLAGVRAAAAIGEAMP